MKQEPVPPPATSIQSEQNPPAPTKRWSEEELQKLGITVFESETLRLLVDRVRPEEQVSLQRIPLMANQFVQWLQQTYPGLQLQTGPDFQLTGYLMRDRALFLQAGLLPEELADIEHGMERGREFWLSDQPTPYYREHLLLHEATHCLMNQQPHEWPVWFLEGTAEFFAGHRWKTEDIVEFGVFPGEEQIAAGFGRISLLQSEMQAGRFRRIDQVLGYDFKSFYPQRSSYAWSWAFCSFLARHPATADRFPELFSQREDSEFYAVLAGIIPSDQPESDADWAVFIAQLLPDYDFQRSAIQWTPSPPKGEKSTGATGRLSQQTTIQANKNWQASGIRLEAGKTYRLRGNGRYRLGNEGEVWECEPQGVSVDYFAGQPAGALQMVLYRIDPLSPTRDSGFFEIIPLGREMTFVSPTAGELFFRVNDLANSWQNNDGQAQIDVQQIALE